MQDAWLKWSADDRSQVADPKAYLARIVSNLSVERLRSTRRQRETYVGPWLPEPISPRPTPPRTSRPRNRSRWRCSSCWRHSARMERAVFVLKEVFDFSYAEIGEAVERSESAVRRRDTAHADTYGRGGPVRSRPHQEARSHRAVLRRRRPAATSTHSWNCSRRRSRCGPTAAARCDRRCARSSARRTWPRWIAGNSRRPYEGVEISDMTAEVVEINGGPGIVLSGAGRAIATITVDWTPTGASQSCTTWPTRTSCAPSQMG